MIFVKANKKKSTLFPGTINDALPLLITFGSGEDQYSRLPSSHFNFTIPYTQNFKSNAEDEEFTFVNQVPSIWGVWHAGQWDHTSNDTNGIDPTREELEKISERKTSKETKKHSVIQRFVYVNAASQSSIVNNIE
ncbi:unnamed protein product [Adineta ricciae]|uniref:Uncharacterized protein n=1 Tax=Adineta ricciae TaxID=249248 RepID=A0A815T180_ADIRI|nr:unnamed protein product [Adineta ricciae]